MNPTVSVNLGQLASLARLESGADCTDKGALDHNFVEIYEKFFFQWKEEPIRILEIGIYGGGSLELWYKYFSKASVFGIDIDPKQGMDNDRVQTFVADQSNRNQLQKFIDINGGDFDIIIDDGGHTMEQQQISLGCLFPYVKSGGYYVIEDLHTSLPHIWPTFKATPETSTLTMLENFVRGTPPIMFSRYMRPYEMSDLQNNIDFVNINSRIRNDNRSITCLLKKK